MENRVVNFIGKAHYNIHLGGNCIWGKNNKNQNTELIATICGYRSIQKLCKDVNEANDFHDEIGRFIAEAINEKIDRHFNFNKNELNYHLKDSSRPKSMSKPSINGVHSLTRNLFQICTQFLLGL